MTSMDAFWFLLSILRFSFVSLWLSRVVVAMKPTLYKTVARQLHASPAIPVDETGHKPDFQDRNMSKPKWELLSCEIDANA